ncbi:MAG: hypothetical protein K2O03_11830, partial [Lachnospiraceae bacterium]|nr:hypothetical protein [Lachnospiraceae bacterium]
MQNRLCLIGGKYENLPRYEEGDAKRVQQRGEDIFSDIKAVWFGLDVFGGCNEEMRMGTIFKTEFYKLSRSKSLWVLMFFSFALLIIYIQPFSYTH